MTVIALVSETTRPEAVLFEAERHAAELDTDIHVVYLIGMGWVRGLEWWIVDQLPLGGSLEMVRDLARRQATLVAEPILVDFTPVGLAGDPIRELTSYAELVDAECIVIDGDARLAVGIASLFRDPINKLGDHDINVIAVYE